jgi:hypothetical protein
LPPVTTSGSNVIETACGGNPASTVIVPFAPTPLLVAYIGTAIVRVTGEVVIVKLALSAPAGTVTVAGIPIGPLVISVTVRPPAGAGWFRVKMPCAEPPPVTVVGYTWM